MWKQLQLHQENKPFLELEIAVSEKSADISKICDIKKIVSVMYPNPTKF